MIEKKFDGAPDSRLVTPETLDMEDVESEFSLRPTTMSEYIGQEKVKNQLSI